MVTDHLRQINHTDTLQVLGTLLTASLQHQAIIHHHLKVILHRLLDQEELHKLIPMDNMVLLAATILHRHHNIIKDMVHLQAVMVNTDHHQGLAIKYPLIQDQGPLQLDLRALVSMQVMTKAEDTHLIHKADLYHQVQGHQVLRLRHNDKRIPENILYYFYSKYNN